MQHAVSGAATIISGRNTPIERNDLVRFVLPFISTNIDFNNVELLPGDLGVVLNLFDTPFGEAYEILCSGEIIIDVPSEKIISANQ